MIIGRQWKAHDAVALQRALRLSNASFAAVLDVAETTVARWHRPVNVLLRPRTQRKLDTALHNASSAARQRFGLIHAQTDKSAPDQHVDPTSDPVPPVDGADTVPEKARPAANDGMDGAWTADSALRAMGAVVDSGPMQRRHFLALLGAELTAPAHHWLLARPAADLAASAGTRVHEATVDQIDAITAGLRRLDDQLGGGTLLTMVREHLRHVIRLLTDGTYTDNIGRRLHTSAAELLRLGGWISFDNGAHAHAQRYWYAALRAAHTAGDNALGANILGFMSCQAKDLGHHREAITLAESALAGYRGTSPRVSAIIHLRAAEAHATSGAGTDTERALAAAFTSLDTPSTSEPDWSYWLDPAQAHAQAGFCYLQLRQHSNARDHISQALRLQDPTNAREAALRHTLLATTCLRQKDTDLDQAVDHAERALDLLDSDVSSQRCNDHLATIARDFAPHHGHTSVQHLTERVAELTTRT